jgi:hypothetical protein
VKTSTNTRDAVASPQSATPGLRPRALEKVAYVLFFFGRRSIMDTISRSLKRRTNPCQRAAAPILGPDSIHLRQKGPDWVTPFFSPNSWKTNHRHTEAVGRFFEASILETVFHVTGFVPVFRRVRRQTKCHSMQSSGNNILD